MEKICFKCKEAKEVKEFYKHPGMKDGLLGKCKKCACNDSNSNRQKNYEYYISYDRKRANLPHRVKMRLAYAKTINGKKSHRVANDKWRKNNAEKRKAHDEVWKAYKEGRLKKMACEICNTSSSIHAHHDDYSKPLEVRWLCSSHHRLHHLNKV